MKILSLIGPSSCGKTTTIENFFNLIVDKSEVKNKKQERGNVHDFSAVLIWKDKTISILSMGDYANRIKELLFESETKKYDFFICTCNDRFVTPQQELKKRNAYILEKEKILDESLHQSVNNQYAQKILDWLNNEIK